MKISYWIYINCIVLIIGGLNILTVDPTLPPLQLNTYLMWNGIAMLCSTLAIFIYVVDKDLDANKEDGEVT